MNSHVIKDGAKGSNDSMMKMTKMDNDDDCKMIMMMMRCNRKVTRLR